jgi:cytochrome c oxidase subunit 2
LTTRAWFTANAAGTYDILCAEYCGLLHSQMRSTLVAVPGEQFSKWYTGEEVEIAGVSSPIGPPGGEALISQFGCSSCHSSDGSKLVGPSFKGMFGAPARVMEDGVSRTIIVDEPYLRRHILDHDGDIVAGYP